MIEATITPSSHLKTGVYLTQFPEEALTDHHGKPVDWSDHREAHKAVSRLFAPRLSGPATTRRATAGILYRRDLIGPDRTPTILVQSLVSPELTPPNSRTTEISRAAWNVDTHDRVAFRLAINPIRRITKYFDDAKNTTPRNTPHTVRSANGSRDRSHTRQIRTVVPTDQLRDWFSTKLSPALTDLEIIGHHRDETRTGSGPHRYKIVVDSLDGIARVSDPNALSDLRIKGVGREKAYGCGLLTVTRQPELPNI